MPQATPEPAASVRFETKTRELWWREQGITRFVAGVFEGGGAKGLLYEGALEAMVEDRDRPCWFSAVAGSSAGAITATLIAAGLEPVQVAHEAAEPLRALRKPTFLSGLRRVRGGVSYLDQDSLLDWLREVLERQVQELCSEDGGDSVTFKELYELTDIELDVVAVDLKRQRPVIFNYVSTPRCPVAEAVVASTAIPLAFEWKPFGLPPKPVGFLADGGMMANYPTFVFKDVSFREWAGLRQHPPGVPVLGFLLEEKGRADAARSDLYSESSFWPPWSQWQGMLKAMIENPDGEIPEPMRPEFRPRREQPAAAGRPTRLGARLARLGARLARGLGTPLLRVAGTHPWSVFLGGFLAASLFIGISAYFVAWQPLAAHVGDWINGEVGFVDGVIWSVFWVLWSLVPIYAWTVVSIVFFVGWLIGRTAELTGQNAVKTLLQGACAPVWAGQARDDHVVRLSVPCGLTTLTDRTEGDEFARALDDARAATRAELLRLEFRDAPS
jgi:predicted acylesterase/phospholipase RssA